MNYFENITKLPILYQSLNKGLKYQRNFIQKTIAIDIEEIKKNIDNSLNDLDFKKITKYYSYAVPALLGESFCILRGKALTKKERYAMTYLGALSGLFDDFFDEKNTSENHIKKLIDNPIEHFANNSHELLFIRFYKKALDNSEDIKLLKKYFIKVYDAQVLSKKQKLSYTDKDEIRYITILKGGVSFLFYRSVLHESISADEEKMIYNLGGLFQLENDIFDIYKDYVNNIRTLATIETKIDNLRKFYKLLMEETYYLVQLTNFHIKRKKKFLRFISLIILRGFVCLDNLEKKENSTNSIFSLRNYNRNDLICDMEKINSIIKLLIYYVNLNIEFKNNLL
jgi:hypothetical protein